jgi:hypothetical protein
LVKFLTKLSLSISCLYGEERHDFDAGKSFKRALKIETFLDHEMPMYEAIAIWAQKSRDFQAPPLPMALEMARPKNVTILRAHPFPMAFEMDGGGRCDEYLLTIYFVSNQREG